jgi:hypothetical protein
MPAKLPCRSSTNVNGIRECNRCALGLRPAENKANSSPELSHPGSRLVAFPSGGREIDLSTAAY